MDVGEILSISAERFENQPAVHLCSPSEHDTISYLELDRQSNRVANGLKKIGLEEGDSLGLLSRNSEGFLEIFFASQKLGIIIVPINPRSTASEVEYIISDAGIDSLVIQEEIIETTAGLEEVVNDSVENQFIIGAEDKGSYAQLRDSSTKKPDDSIRPNAIDGYYYTSGNTGDPKGVVHTHSDRVEVCTINNAELGFTSEDVALMPMPLFHSGPLHAGFLPNIQAGVPTVLTRRFEPEFVFECIERYEATNIGGVPAQFNSLVECEDRTGYDVSSLQYWWFSGAPMSESLRKQCQEVFCEQYSEIYGTTETGPPITLLRPEESQDHPDSCGNGRLNHRVRVVETDLEDGPDPEATVPQGEIGEIIVKGPTIMNQYLGLPDQTNEVLIDGWYFTGDLAYKDKNGYFHIQGRKDSMIISGGENIYPSEIEDVLLEHPDIADIAVIGVSHEKWGSTPKAYVVVKQDRTLTESEVLEYCRESSELANYKSPTEVAFVDGIPRNPGGGSVLTSELKEIN